MGWVYLIKNCTCNVIAIIARLNLTISRDKSYIEVIDVDIENVIGIKRKKVKLMEGLLTEGFHSELKVLRRMHYLS